MVETTLGTRRPSSTQRGPTRLWTAFGACLLTSRSLWMPSSAPRSSHRKGRPYVPPPPPETASGAYRGPDTTNTSLMDLCWPTVYTERVRPVVRSAA
eukprot:scaffold940_cov569-Prasinococcus_capsulatus_cf.AAC.20